MRTIKFTYDEKLEELVSFYGMDIQRLEAAYTKLKEAVVCGN